MDGEKRERGGNECSQCASTASYRQEMKAGRGTIVSADWVVGTRVTEVGLPAVLCMRAK